MSTPRPPFRILAICVPNSALSQMAEAVVETRGQKRPMGAVLGESAGTRPTNKVSEYAIVTLGAHGIGWARRETKGLDAFAGEAFDLVITLDDRAANACPAFPGARAQVHWPLPDPSEHVSGATARADYAQAYAAIVARVNPLLRLPLETLSDDELRAQAQAIHDGLAAPKRRSSGRLRRPT